MLLRLYVKMYTLCVRYSVCWIANFNIMYNLMRNIGISQ